MPTDEIHRLEPDEFERLVANVWEEYGFECEITPSGKDKGVDIIASKPEPVPTKHVIQAKRYNPKNKISSPQIQQYAALQTQIEGTDSVVVVTSSEFTGEAIELANQLGVKTVDGEVLAKLLDKNDLITQISRGEFKTWLGEREMKTCPYCGDRINNMKHSFVLHWEDSPTCSGPTPTRPSGFRRLSKQEWQDLVSEVQGQDGDNQTTNKEGSSKPDQKRVKEGETVQIRGETRTVVGAEEAGGPCPKCGGERLTLEENGEVKYCLHCQNSHLRDL